MQTQKCSKVGEDDQSITFWELKNSKRRDARKEVLM